MISFATARKYLTTHLAVIIAWVLIWRGLWYGLDALDEHLFGGIHLWTALSGALIGLIIIHFTERSAK